MSQAAQEAQVQKEAQPKLSAMQHLKLKLAGFIQQRDQIVASFEQLKGAIFACEEMIKTLEAEANEHSQALALSNGDSKDGEASDKSAEQVAQE